MLQDNPETQVGRQKVLVVDDSKTVREHMRFFLEPLNFDIIEAADGEEAMVCMEQHADIRLIFCDVYMPNMNGLEFAKRLHQRSKQAGASSIPPLIMLTTESSRDVVQEGKAYGVASWILKPPTVEIIKRVLERFLKT
jgi:two-component system chemotaxis response regulator CheY